MLLTNAQDSANGAVTQSASGQFPAKKTISILTACLGSGTIEVAIIGVMSVSEHCPELLERDQSSTATLPESQQYTAQVTTQGSVIWEASLEE